MVMHPDGRKRRVSTCVPCHTRKQKVCEAGHQSKKKALILLSSSRFISGELCNRQYPCNHCTRRRRPEECLYSGSPAVSLTSKIQPPRQEAQGRPLETAKPSMVRANLLESGGPRSAVSDEAKRHSYSRRSALAQSFGYFEDSSCNTMALLQRVALSLDSLQWTLQVLTRLTKSR